MTKHTKNQLTNEEIEYRLAKAVSQTVPDIYEESAHAPISPLTAVDDILPRQFPYRRRSVSRLLAASFLLLCLIGSFVAYTWFSIKAVLSIDVNPSVALSINRYERVIEVQPLNDDGDDLLEELSLNGLRLDTALDALMGAMNRKGYLDGNTVHLFVDGKDEKYNQELYEEVSEMIAHLVPNPVTPSSPEQENTSPAPMPEQETSPKPTPIPDSESMPEATPIPETQIPPASSQILSKEQVKQIVLNQAGLTDDLVSWEKIEYEEDDGEHLYELEFYYGSTEYSYEVDAFTGSILKFEEERKD